jgi:hypothetical protein
MLSGKEWMTWLKGGVAAFVSGGAGAGSTVIADVVKDGKAELDIKGLAITFLVMGITGLFLYLKQSPLPKDEPE